MQKKWKKVMAGTLGVCMLATCAPTISEFGGHTKVSEVVHVQAATKSKKLSGTCGKKAKWSYNKKTKVLTISGTGAMKDYRDSYDEEFGEDYGEESLAPWASALKNYKVKKVVIGDGITHIGNCAFEDISVNEVKLGKKVKTIGYNAFYRRSKLKKVTSGKKVESVGIDAFYGCTSLVEVDLGTKVKEIDTAAFSGCDKLEKIDLGKNIEQIGAWAFLGCHSLKEVNVGDKLKKIENDAFLNCEELTSFYVGKSLESIGTSAFEGCEALEEIKVHKDNQYFVLKENVLYNKEMTKLYYGNFNVNSTCYISDNVVDLDGAVICDSRIENFEVSSKNETFSSEDGMLYTKDGTKLLICPKGKTGTAVVQDRALQIGMNTLDAPNEYKSENDELEAIADGRVNSNAYKQWTSPFSNCAKLEKVVIGKKVKYIYDDFSDYKWLKEIEVDAENKYFTVENGVIVAKK